MSFVLSEPSGTIKYNFYRTPFYKNLYEKTIKKNGMLQMQYFSKSNDPTIIYLKNTYVAVKLYIVKKIHSIKGIDYDATMIIEHKSTTNKRKPLYVCFLLKTGSKIKTELDRIIDPDSNIKPELDTKIDNNSTSITLNDYIESTTAIVYENDDLIQSPILIFTTPILINSNLTNLKQSHLYLAPYVNNYNTSTVKVILENKVEGLDTMAGYCQPISEHESAEANKLLLEVDTSLTPNKTVITTTIYNWIMFVAIIVFTIGMFPLIYTWMFIRLIKVSDQPPQQKLSRLYAIDIILILLFFGSSINFIYKGAVYDNMYESYIGIIIFITLICSIISIGIQRYMFKQSFFDSITKTPQEVEILMNTPMNSIFPDLFGLLYDNFYFWELLLCCLIILLFKYLAPFPIPTLYILLTLIILWFIISYMKSK
jgi:hypothetical protein